MWANRAATGTSGSATGARTVGLQLLAADREALGSPDRVAEVVKVFGMVNADVEAGCHARSAVGMGTLPAGISVGIEAIFAVR